MVKIMIVKELIKLLKENWIDATEILPLDRATEVTKAFLVKSKISKPVIAKFESIPLWSVRGIGPVLAVELWAKGVRPGNLEKHKALLPDQTKLVLKYKPLERIPHDLVTKIAAKFIPTGEKTKCVIVGSYRRLKPTSGDVDILYSTKKDDLQRFLDKLVEVHGKNWILFAQGPSKIAGIFCFEDPKPIAVEVDLWIATPDNKHSMLLYATGSKLFNVRMRAIAKRKGMKLNQYGLFDSTNKIIPTKTERDIFDHLQMDWKKPEERE